MKISTEKTSENIKTILGILGSSSVEIKKLAANVDDYEVPIVVGKRSFKETLAHLIHCDIVSTDGIYLALMKKEPVLEKVHPERDIGKLLKLNSIDFRLLLGYFDVRREIFLQVLKGLKYSDWDRVVVEAWEKRRESVYWKCRGQALHEKHHLDIVKLQIQSNTRNR